MATIGTVNVGAFGLPDRQPRTRRTSHGMDAAGGTRMLNLGAKTREIVVILRRKTATVIADLETFLFANETANITITPDSHVDLGAGAGVAITTKWIDARFDPSPFRYQAWDVTLVFRKV